MRNEMRKTLPIYELKNGIKNMFTLFNRIVIFPALLIFSISIISTELSFGQTADSVNQPVISSSTVVQQSGSLKYPAAMREDTVDTYFGTKFPVPLPMDGKIKSP